MAAQGATPGGGLGGSAAASGAQWERAGHRSVMFDGARRAPRPCAPCGPPLAGELASAIPARADSPLSWLHPAWWGTTLAAQRLGPWRRCWKRTWPWKSSGECGRVRAPGRQGTAFPPALASSLDAAGVRGERACQEGGVRLAASWVARGCESPGHSCSLSSCNRAQRCVGWLVHRLRVASWVRAQTLDSSGWSLQAGKVDNGLRTSGSFRAQ